ncbi:MAG: site-specific DNA-methyltransferase [Clostridia bacterium]|nr:site-specific DNA-methyltransferase [Clostridia bacterium]
MSINISKQNKQQLLEKLKAIKGYLKGAEKTQETAELLSFVDEIERELKSKKYGLVFEEHREEIEELLERSTPVLKEDPALSIDHGGIVNALIEGDNLASLTALKTEYFGKVDVIYIDPPYNKGKGDFGYQDKYVGDEDAFRHSKWSSFMLKRLELAKELLCDDGVIFISIDDNEIASLRLLCDRVFGEKNRLSVHHIQVRYGNKSLNEKKDFQEVCEYVLIYAKNARLFHANKPAEEYSLDKFCYEIKETGEYTEEVIGGRNVKIFKKGAYEIVKRPIGCLGFLKATWASGSVVKGNASGKYFETYLKPRKEIDGLGTLYKVDGIGEDGLGYRYFTGPNKAEATQGLFYSGVPLARVREMAEGGSKKYRPIGNFYDFAADFGNIRHEGGVAFNSGKKPTKMLKQFIGYHPKKDALVLDFFAGSASTGHAVLDLNDEDGGNRRFIMCTSAEQNICREVAYVRLKNVIEKTKKTSLKFYTVEFEEGTK